MRFDSFMSNAEKDQHKKASRAILVLFGGPLLIAIGVGIGGGMGWGLAVLGLLGMVAAVWDIVKTVKAKRAAKQRARDEAEIRAYHLRQARGQA
jgi:F0F1-type ATP synthase assembly protein I